jgi:aminodeoxyfutalosine synthase
VAQTALWFGVDDLDGTVQEEKIYHMAGSRTPEALSTGDIERLIVAAGRVPVERDTFYNVVRTAASAQS